MRHISFIAAFAFILAAPSVAGSNQNNLPSIGTFSYPVSPVVAPAPAMVVAGLTLAQRS